jgi:hypothetical protein
MENEIDLRQVKVLMAKKDGTPLPTFEGPYMFFYVVFTFIENKQFSTLSEQQAKEMLSRYPKMETFLLKFPKSTTPIPAIITKRRGLQTEPCTSFEQASEIILTKTGVLVPQSDLMVKQKMRMQDNRPLVSRVQDLKESIIVQETHDQGVQRILKCLKENDPHKRNQCLNNC